MKKMRIDPLYTGPTIVEMESLLPLSNDPIEVRWENTKPEIRLLRQHPDRAVTLVVRDLSVMERTATTLGMAYVLHRELIEDANKALRDGTWREFAARQGPQVARSVALRLLALNLRAGRQPGKFRRLVEETLFENTAPVDLDTLRGLQSRGARV